MSKRALALGIVKYLRTYYGDTDGSFFGAQRDLRPPPAMGQWYVSVGKVTARRGPNKSADVNDAVYTAQLAITLKLGYAPQDRQTSEIERTQPDQDFAGPATPTPQAAWELTQPGMEEFADQLVGLLLESYDVINVCNTYINGFGTTTNGFVEPFHQEDIGDVREEGGSWCGLEDASEGQIQVLNVTVSGAYRIRLRGTIT